MAKIRLNEQKNYNYSTKLRARVGDINYGGHVGNVELIGLLHQARVDILTQMGFSETNFGNNKTVIIMTDIVVNYIKEIFINEEFVVEINFDNFEDDEFRIYYRILKNGKLTSLGETGMVTIDMTTMKRTAVPKEFLTIVE